MSSTRQTYRPPPPVNYQPQFTSPNPFAPLATNDIDDRETLEDDNIEQNKPPLINLKPTTNFINVCKTIADVVGEQAFTCKARIDVLSIQANSPDTYRKIIKHLQSTCIEHFTYQFKNERAYRVVIRHLHPSTPVELIKEELGKIGFTVINVVNILQRTTKTPLPLYFVNLKPAPNNKDIFSLRRLLYTAISVEEPHRKMNVPQCSRCQGYHHTRNYCEIKPACVKCAGPHWTNECTKTPDTPATCLHCHQPHPANYRGCSIYKEIVARRNRSRSRQRAAPMAQLPSQTADMIPPSGHQPSEPQRETQQQQSNIATEVSRPSYASAVKSHLPPQPPFAPPRRSAFPYIPPPNSSCDITTTINNLNLLIHNLQSLIAPLSNLLEKVTRILSVLQP